MHEKFKGFLKEAGKKKEEFNTIAYFAIVSLRDLWKLEHKAVYWFFFALKHAAEFVLAITETYVVNVDKPLAMVLIDCAIAIVSPIAAILLHYHERLLIPAWLLITLAGLITLVLKGGAGVMVHWKTLPEAYVRAQKDKSIWAAWYGPIVTGRDHWNIIGPALSELFDAGLLLNSQASMERITLPPGAVFDGLLEYDDKYIVLLTKEERRDLIYSVIGKLYHSTF